MRRVAPTMRGSSSSATFRDSRDVARRQASDRIQALSGEVLQTPRRCRHVFYRGCAFFCAWGELPVAVQAVREIDQSSTTRVRPVTTRRLRRVGDAATRANDDESSVYRHRVDAVADVSSGERAAPARAVHRRRRARSPRLRAAPPWREATGFRRCPVLAQHRRAGVNARRALFCAATCVAASPGYVCTRHPPLVVDSVRGDV